MLESASCPQLCDAISLFERWIFEWHGKSVGKVSSVRPAVYKSVTQERT